MVDDGDAFLRLEPDAERCRLVLPRDAERLDRRRVQLAYGLMIEYSVLLLDEITVDLDVLGRADLMSFLRQECEERNVTIVYATHIFDGLE